MWKFSKWFRWHTYFILIDVNHNGHSRNNNHIIKHFQLYFFFGIYFQRFVETLLLGWIDKLTNRLDINLTSYIWMTKKKLTENHTMPDDWWCFLKLVQFYFNSSTFCWNFRYFLSFNFLCSQIYGWSTKFSLQSTWNFHLIQLFFIMVSMTNKVNPKNYMLYL